MINRTVRPVHFEDFSGADFERLVFAYHLRAGWLDLAWYGETGSDLGRDIIGIEPRDGQPDRRTVIQCVNRARLTQAKAEHDMALAVAAPTGRPDAFKFVCRTAVSAERRDAIRKAGRSLGVADVYIWSGVEFEEQLRLRAEFLLRRLVDGMIFPDSEVELRRFVDDFPGLTDDDALAIMAAVLDRPALRTPFHLESHLPAFQQAIEDTVGAFNTGVWRTRDGVEIRRIPSLHHLKSPALRNGVGKVVRELDAVRRLFQQQLEDGRVRRCGCDNSECPTFFFTDFAAHELDAARSQALLSFRAIYPRFDVEVR